MEGSILIVDDEAPIRELLRLSFRKRGLEVTTARTVQEAKEITRRTAIALVILDVNLAGENGFELLSFFRANHPSVPVLIFTGLTGQDLVDQALAGGAVGVMHKTESLESLFKTVSGYLQQ